MLSSDCYLNWNGLCTAAFPIILWYGMLPNNRIQTYAKTKLDRIIETYEQHSVDIERDELECDESRHGTCRFRRHLH